MATARNQPQRRNQGQQGPRRRILRVGILLGDTFIEERLVRERGNVTIGQSAKNTFSIPIEGLPMSFPLFTEQNGTYFLSFSAQMDGRISDGGAAPIRLAELRTRGAQQRGDSWMFQLTDHARGKIELGDMKLLFQFVTEPPLQPRPHLPASIRGSFIDRIDPHLAVVLAISLLFHGSIFFWAMRHDPPDKSRAARVYADTFQRPAVSADDLQFDTPKTPDTTGDQPSDKPADKPADKPSDNKPANKPSDKPAGNAGDGKPAGRTDGDRVALQEEASRFADGLFSDNEGEDSILSGGMSGRKPGTDLGDQIAHVRDSNAKVELGGGSGGGTRGDGSAKTGTGTGPKIDGPTGTTSTGGKTVEKVPTGRINISDKTGFDDTTLTPDMVLAKIKSAYMTGLQRCHKDLLKRDPTGGGKVTLSFTVNETGRTVSAKAKGFDSGVDACIEQRMSSWRFGIPKDSDGEATDAGFKITLALQAN